MHGFFFLFIVLISGLKPITALISVQSYEFLLNFPVFLILRYSGKYGMFLGVPFSVGGLSTPTEGDR